MMRVVEVAVVDNGVTAVLVLSRVTVGMGARVVLPSARGPLNIHLEVSVLLAEGNSDSL